MGRGKLEERDHGTNSDHFWMVRLQVIPTFFFMFFYILYNYHITSVIRINVNKPQP